MSKLLINVAVSISCFFFLFSSFSLFGQNNETNKIQFDSFASIVLSYFNDFNINKEFRKNNLPELNNYLLGIEGGINSIYMKNLLSIDYSIHTYISNDINTTPRTSFNITSQSLLYYRQIFSIYNDLLYIGLGYEYSTYSAIFYLKSNPLNISNISQNDFTNILQLYNSSHSAKPSLIFKIKNDSIKTYTSIRISYSYNLYQSKWKSANSSTTSSFADNLDHLTLSCSYFF